MNLPRSFAVFSLFAFAFLANARAAEIDGKWSAEFDTQVGVQKYVFELKADGEKLTGKATFERMEQKGELELKEGKIVKDAVTFVELLKFQDMEMRVEYTGKLAGDEIKFTRKVGDVATEELVAKRVKPAAAPAKK
jgi:hypothetical protein